MKIEGNSMFIMFWDLTPEAQTVFLRFKNMKSPDDGDYSSVPVAVVRRN
jgi:hypothetical protein